MTLDYNLLMYFHLATVVPATVIGMMIFLKKKGTKFHKQFGRIYVVLMLCTAVLTLFMPATVGKQFLGHFGYIHVFSVMVLSAIPLAIIRVKNGNIKAHKRAMVLLYVGAIGIAGFFAFMPGRYLHELLFG